MEIPYSHASEEENTLHLLHDYLTRTLTAPYPSSDPIRLIVHSDSDDGDGNDDDGRLGSNSNSNSNSGNSGSDSSSGCCPITAINPTILSARPHDILRLARDKLHAWPYQDVPVCWRRVVIESVLWCCVGLLEDQEDKVRVKIKTKERINKEEEEEEETSQDWVAEFVRVLDEGVIVSGAPGREEVVEKVLEILDEWLLRRSGRKRNGKRKRVIDWVGVRQLWQQLQQQQQQQEEKKGTDGKDSGEEEEDDDNDDQNEDDMNVENESRRKRKKISGSMYGNGDFLSDDYFYPPHINPLPPRFSACTPSPSVFSTSIPIDYPIQRCERPSLADFESHLRGMKGILKTDRTVDREFCTVDGHKDVDFPTPLVLKSCISHWPAICDPTRSWDSPRYLLSRALGGRRLVPVEIGRSYVDEGWGQKIVPFGEFMEMVLDDDDVDVDYFNGQLDGQREEEKFNNGRTKFCEFGDMNDKGSKNRAGQNTRGNLEKDSKQDTSEEVKRRKRPKRQKWYLAQHDLFTQMPALRADIAIPEYCYLSSIPTPPSSPEASPTSELPLSPPPPSSPLRQIHLNAWLGPAGTISPLHTDPHHNILAQVVGRKYVRLYAPSHTEKVYPRGVDSNGSSSSNSRRKRTKEHGGMSNADGDQDGDDDDDDNSKATTPHQSANTSHVDVSNVLAWVWEWEAGDGSSSNGDDDDDDDVRYNPPHRSLPHQQHQQHHHQQKQQYQKALQTIRTKYPLFLDAPYLETILEPGECLFIPRSWWHYVRSLSPSFSVSFWWD